MTKTVIRFFFLVYQGLISPVIHLLAGPGMGCRFTPTCSEYSKEALDYHGLVRGSILSFLRICRCHPWAKSGFDPVPRKRIDHGP